MPNVWGLLMGAVVVGCLTVVVLAALDREWLTAGFFLVVVVLVGVIVRADRSALRRRRR